MPAFRFLLPIALAIGIAASPAAFALPGNLDATFGIGGQGVIPPFGGYQSWGYAEDSLRAVKALPGGKYLLAGVGRQGTRTQALAVRLNADGTRDTSFGAGGDGIVRVDISGSAPDVADIAAHPTDGYVFLTTTNGEDMLLVSLAANGQGSMAGFGAFGNTGAAPVSVPHSVSLRARKIAWDGSRYLIGYEVLFAPGLAEDFAATRVNADGTPDGTWGTRAAGYQCAPVRLYAMRIDAAGRPVLAGQCQTAGPGAASQSIVTRFTAAGDFDTTFNAAQTSNRRAFDVEAGAEDGFRTLDIDASDRLVLSGSVTSAANGNQPTPFTARLTPDGEPDASYGFPGSGFAFYPGNAGGEYPAVALGTNGRLFLGGHVPDAIDRLSSFIALTEGGYDPAMNSGGFVSERNAENATYRFVDAVAANGRFVAAIEMGSEGNRTWRLDWQDEATLAFTTGNTGNRTPSDPVRSTGASRAITFRPGGYIVAGSATDESGTRRFEVAELNANGGLSMNLGGTSRLLLAQQGIARAAVVDSLGRIYLAGENNFGVATLVRLLSTGIPDASFGMGGSLAIDPTGEGGDIRAIALQADGKILLAGRLVSGGVGFAWIARLETTGAVDATFGTNAGYTIAGSDAAFGALVVRPDGRILAAGHTTTGGRKLFLVAQFVATGAFDAAFGSGGQVNYANGAFDNEARALALLPGDRIAVFGRYFNGAAWNGIGHRLLADGNLDGPLSTAVIAPTAGNWEVNAALAQPDGRLLLTGAGNGETLNARLLPSTLEPDPSWEPAGVTFFSQFVTGGYGIVHERGYGGVATIAVQGRNESQGAIRIQAPVVPNLVAYLNGPVSLQVGTPGTFTITLANATGFDVQGFSGSVNYGSAVLTNASVPITNCPGLVSGALGASGFTLSGTGVALPDQASCTVTLNLVASAAGSVPFEIPARSVFTVNGGVANSGRAAMTVIAQGTDTTPPETVLFPGAIAGSQASFSFSTFPEEPGAVFECSLNGASFTTCTSPVVLAGLAEGAHQFRVRARDAAGNVDPTPSSYAWSVADATPPETVLIPGAIAGSQASFSFSTFPEEPGAVFECSLDGASFATCISPVVLAGLAEGAHQFRVRARDAAGNVDPTPSSYAWNVADTTPPDTLIFSQNVPSGGTTFATRATFDFVTSPQEAATFECALDGAPFAFCPGNGITYLDLAPGPHEMRARARDLAGNVDPTPATFSWTVLDSTPPDTVIVASNPANGTFTDATTLTVQFAGVGTAQDFRCAIDGFAYQPCTSPFTAAGPFGPGAHIFRVVAVNAAQLPDPTPATVFWQVRIPQSITFAQLPDIGINAWPMPLPQAFATSGQAVTFTALTPTTCGVHFEPSLGRWAVDARAAGTCTIAADQDGPLANYAPAPRVERSLTVVPRPNPNDVRAVAAGEQHTCALAGTGDVKCWGANASGQLGNGTTVASSTPVDVVGLSGHVLAQLGEGAVAIAVGDRHSCAVLMGSGEVKCWGSNAAGQLGDGTTVQRTAPVFVLDPGAPSGRLGNVVALAAGRNHACALTGTGSVKCWGSNGAGQLGDGTQANRLAPVAVLTAPNVPLGAADSIVAGASHTCVVLRPVRPPAAMAYCWGANASGQLGYGGGDSGYAGAVQGQPDLVASLAAGADHTCALTPDARVQCWGGNSAGQLGNGTTTDSGSPVAVIGLDSVAALTAGDLHTCALGAAGGVKCWGRNADGQLGDGTDVSRSTPVAVGGLASRVVSVDGGQRHTCAATGDGSALCWGGHTNGQLGIGGVAPDTCQGRVQDCAKAPAAVPGTNEPDTVPDAFAFPSRSGVAPGSLQVSAAIRPTGFYDPAAVTVSNGEFSFGCTTTFVTTGTLQPGQSICVRHRTSHLEATITTTVLTIGGVQGTFVTETQQRPTLSLSPERLDFDPRAVGMTGETRTVTVTNAGAFPISDLRAGAGGDFAIESATCGSTLAPGASCTLAIVFRPLAVGERADELLVTASGDGFLTGRVVLSGAGTSADTTPNAFSFADQYLVPPSVLLTSAPVQVTGLSGAAPVSVANGSYCVSATNSCAACTFRQDPATVTDGQYLCARHTSSPVPGGQVDTFVFVGGLGDAFTSITIDTVPAPFSFPPATGVAPGTAQTSAAAAIVGINAPAPVTVTGGEYSVGCTGRYTSAPGTVANGQTVCLRHVSAATPGGSTATVLEVGGVKATFASRVVETTPLLVATPAQVEFGGQSINTTAPGRAVTVSNAGTGPLTVASVDASAGFTATHGCTAIAAGASCEIAVYFTPAAEGALAGTLTIGTSAGNATIALAGVGERSFTTHYYQAILGRAPDAGGKAFWDSEAARMRSLGASVNETWFAMASYFFGSPEYLALGRDDTGFATDLYDTFFNRAPDPGGLAFWTGQLAAGMPREVMLASFMFSPEFAGFAQSVFGVNAVRKEVDMVVDFYRGLLARLPDSDGFAYWVGQFRQAQCQGAAAVTVRAETISSAFAQSPEYAGRARTNEQYVGDLYNAFLRRGADLAGVQHWIGQLAGGTLTREQVRQQFVAAPEFQGRVVGVVAQGCAP